MWWSRMDCGGAGQRRESLWVHKMRAAMTTTREKWHTGPRERRIITREKWHTGLKTRTTREREDNDNDKRELERTPKGGGKTWIAPVLLCKIYQEYMYVVHLFPLYSPFFSLFSHIPSLFLWTSHPLPFIYPLKRTLNCLPYASHF